MSLKAGAKWLVGLVVAGSVLLLLSIFVADRQLEPPFEEVELGPVDVPLGEPLASGQLLYSSDESGTAEIYLQAAPGAPAQALTGDLAFDSWRPRLSPDRRTIMFYRSPAGVGDTDAAQASLWMMSAQGDDITQVLPLGAHGWRTQAGAEWSPTGDQLVMVGGRPQGDQIWITSVDVRSVRGLVTAPGDNTDPSWSPDAQRVLYVACPESPCAPTDTEIFVTLVAGGGESIQLTSDALADRQPRFSPNGDQIAMRTQLSPADDQGEGERWDIRVVPTNRSQAPRLLLNDGSTSASPNWLDDRTLMVERVEPGNEQSDIVTIRVSDGQQAPLVTGPGSDRYPSS